MILTLVCVEPDKYIVVEDEGFVSQYLGIKLRPASSREGSIICGPCSYEDAAGFIANRNHLEKL